MPQINRTRRYTCHDYTYSLLLRLTYLFRYVQGYCSALHKSQIIDSDGRWPVNDQRLRPSGILYISLNLSNHWTVLLDPYGFFPLLASSDRMRRVGSRRRVMNLLALNSFSICSSRQRSDHEFMTARPRIFKKISAGTNFLQRRFQGPYHGEWRTLLCKEYLTCTNRLIRVQQASTKIQTQIPNP